MALEADIRAYDALNSALILLQQAQSELTRVESYTIDTKLRHISQDMQGTLSLLRDAGNRELNKLKDLLDE
jgi:hypothetical protein